ncbi:TPA: hypothetical protein ACF1IQ_004582, partial [Yersinia enterocolitica]
EVFIKAVRGVQRRVGFRLNVDYHQAGVFVCHAHFLVFSPQQNTDSCQLFTLGIGGGGDG